MPQVVTVRGYAVKVFTDDHGSPHVHVLKDAVLLKITLKPVAFVGAKYGHPTDRMIRDALEIVREHHKACFVAWRKIYG
jgi:hypothetical protein